MRNHALFTLMLVSASLLITGTAQCQASKQTAAPAQPAAQKPVVVTLAGKEGQWQLLRDGKPYFIKGAGGGEKLELLVECGGNSLRTWGADDMEGLLNKAQSLGLTVTLGMWLGHRSYFNYDDPRAVSEQFERCKAYVERYKNHPALLMWGIGNEMEAAYGGQNENVWKAVEQIAAYIKKADPNHPTMTVVAELGGENINPKSIARLCPSIDVIGVNSYGGLPTLPERLAKSGWNKPYIVTEFGPPGPWEAGKTGWGASVELSSAEKARYYASNYQTSILGQKGKCVGSYVFLWGDKVEATPTWFGMFLPGTGERLAQVDAMQRLWSGKDLKVTVPEITGFDFSADKKEVAPETKLSARVQAGGSAADRLRYYFEVRPDDTSPSKPDPGQIAPAALKELTPAEGTASTIEFIAPKTPGAYRLYVYVKDGKGGAATANLPFRIRTAE